MHQNINGLGNLPANPLNEVMSFLDAGDIAALSMANKHLSSTIKNNSFAQQKIEKAKQLTVGKIYDIVHKIASSEYQESFWRNGDGRYGVSDEIWSGSVGRALKELGNCKDQTPMVTMLEQWMLLEVLSMDENLFSSDKNCGQIIKDYLTQPEKQKRREEFLEKNYVVDEQDTRWISVFRNFNQIYFDQLSKTKKWDKKTKDTITSKFIKFWLYQGSKIEDLEKNRNVEEYNWPTFSNACKKLKRSFFDSNSNFSIDFKEFINQLTTQELNEYLFENKYYFVDHFKNELVNNIDFVCEQVLSKDKDFQVLNEENINNKFKKLLSYLGVNSELIDEQMIDLSKEETNLSNELGINSELIDQQMVDLSMQKVNSFNDLEAVPLCNNELNSKTPSYQYNSSEISLVQKVISAIKKFFESMNQKAVDPVTTETNNDDKTRGFFSKPGIGDFKNKNYSAPLCVQQNEGLVK